MLAFYSYALNEIYGSLEWGLIFMGWLLIGLLLTRLFGKVLNGEEMP